MEKTKAEKLAFTLNFLIENDNVPGLLPKDVREAAELLVAQEKRLATLEAALATKDHIVTVEVTERHYRKKIRGEFVIADPRIYFGEIEVDSFMVEEGPPDWVEHVARNLVGVVTRDWLRDLHEKAFIATCKALSRDRSPKGRDNEDWLGRNDESANSCT